MIHKLGFLLASPSCKTSELALIQPQPAFRCGCAILPLLSASINLQRYSS
jgi:hypothetical protein